MTDDLRARQPKAIHSALTVLEEVARCGTGVTAQEISRNLALPRATAYRLLNLLVQDEYLVRMPDLRGFALGRKVSELAQLVTPDRPPQAVREVLDRLRQGVRGGVHLVRYDSRQLRIVDADPDFPLSDEPRIIRHLDASAIGRLLLADLHLRGEISALATLKPQQVGPLVKLVQQQGYAMQFGELVPSLGCLAVPIRDPAGRLVAGLSLSAPLARLADPQPLLERLLGGSRELAPLLA